LRKGGGGGGAGRETTSAFTAAKKPKGKPEKYHGKICRKGCHGTKGILGKKHEAFHHHPVPRKGTPPAAKKALLKGEKLL